MTTTDTIEKKTFLQKNAVVLGVSTLGVVAGLAYADFHAHYTKGYLKYAAIFGGIALVVGVGINSIKKSNY